MDVTFHCFVVTKIMFYSRIFLLRIYYYRLILTSVTRNKEQAAQDQSGDGEGATDAGKSL